MSGDVVLGSSAVTGAVQDPDSGRFRKDIRIIQIKALEPISDDEFERVATSIKEALEKKGLSDQYLIIATQPELELNILWLDELIKSLQKKRNELWGKQDRAEEARSNPPEPSDEDKTKPHIASF